MQNIPTNLLLLELKEERGKFTRQNDDLVQQMVDELVRRGEYPAVSLSGYTAREMVEGYGAFWHQYSEPLNCPHCQSDLRNLVHGAPFKREIGHYDQGSDRCIGFWCPDCNQQITRFSR